MSEEPIAEKTRFVLAREPRGDAYRQLIAVGARYCDRFGLVIRPELNPDATVENFLEQIEPHVVNDVEAEEWPGTKLLRQRARVLKFALTDSARERLTQAAEGLFDWQLPRLPEDLFLLRPDGTPWLTTIAHERDAFLDLTEEELAELGDRAPALAAILRLDPS